MLTCFFHFLSQTSAKGWWREGIKIGIGMIAKIRGDSEEWQESGEMGIQDLHGKAMVRIVGGKVIKESHLTSGYELRVFRQL